MNCIPTTSKNSAYVHYTVQFIYILRRMLAFHVQYILYMYITQQLTSLIKGRWVAQLVARLHATGSSLGLNPDISQKYNMGDISTGVTNTL
jgi:hypothetical protein